MTSSEWAAWVQAITAAVAIFSAILIANRQTRNQMRHAQDLQRADFMERQKRFAGAVETMATGGKQLITFMRQAVGTRDQLFELGERRNTLDFSELKALIGAVEAVPLYELPTKELVANTLIVASILRQFRDILQSAIVQHRDMDAGDYTDFFNTLVQMDASISDVATKMQQEFQQLCGKQEN